MNLREFLREKKKQASEKQKEKAESVSFSTVDREFLEDYLWRSQDERVEIPAVAVRLEVKVDHKFKRHNVVLAKKDGEWKMWCGDKYLQEEFGWKEDFCFASRFDNKVKGVVCYHQLIVINKILDDELVDEIEKFLEGEKKEEKETVVSKDVLGIGWKKKLPVLLYGRTGAGKSHSIFEFIKKLKEEGENFEVFQINMSSGIEDIDLIAKILPNPKEKSWITLDGELKKAFLTAKEKTVIIFIEELTRASKSARNLLLKAIDSVSGSYVLFDFVKGETISVPTDRIWWVATANLNYSDTDDIDPALLRRFVLTKYVDYDEEAERQMLMEILLDEKEVEKILKMAKALRAMYERGEIPQPLDTGSLKVFAELYAELGDAEAVAEMTFLYRIVDVDATSSPSKEQVEIIKELIEKIFD